MTVHDFAAVQQIIQKTAKFAARHTYLCCLLVQKRFKPDNEMLSLLIEADWCVKSILAQMDEMEGLCERSLLQREQRTEARSEP
jgi:hypothetical protein